MLSEGNLFSEIRSMKKHRQSPSERTVLLYEFPVSK